jgi:hypothetical protein
LCAAVVVVVDCSSMMMMMIVRSETVSVLFMVVKLFVFVLKVSFYYFHFQQFCPFESVGGLQSQICRFPKKSEI